jgi:hypothetical protein
MGADPIGGPHEGQGSEPVAVRPLPAEALPPADQKKFTSIYKASQKSSPTREPAGPLV